MQPQYAVEISGLTKRYKSGVLANDAVELQVPLGCTFGLLGPNGAGKTTLVRQLTGELRPTSGQIQVLGIDVNRSALEAKRLMGIVPQEAGTFDGLTPLEHLRIFGRLHGLSWMASRRKADELLDVLDLQEHRTKMCLYLSGGMKRKLLVGMAVMAAPPLLVLDEPTTGLDPQSRHQVWSLINTLQTQGATVLLTTHYMEEAEAVCDRIAILAKGRLIATGTVEEIRERCRNRFKIAFRNGAGSQVIYGQTPEQLTSQVAGLGIVEYALSKTSLEDLYLELTGNEWEPADVKVPG